MTYTSENFTPHAPSITPPSQCCLCPRLCDYRHNNQKDHPLWHNAPVPSFGSLDAQLLIVGLAPGLSGANKTGRPFTGDGAGILLYKALLTYQLATGTYDPTLSCDTLQLLNTRITNAVRCAPPQNKPTAQEIKNCCLFLKNEIFAMPYLKTIIALGRISHESILKTLELPHSLYPFGHGKSYTLHNITLIDTYHCSRYNTQTKRLTEAMFFEIIHYAKSTL